MSLTKRVAHNTLIQFTGKIVGTVLGVVSLALTTRYLGKEGYGGYTTILTFLSIFGILADMGLYIILVREISKRGTDEERTVQNIFTIRLAVTLVLLGLAPIIALAFPYSTLVKQGILVGTLSYLFISLNQLLTGVFQRHLRMDKVAIGEIIGRVGLLAVTVIVVRFDLGLLWLVAGVVSGSFLNFLFVWLSSREYVRIRLRFDMPVWNMILRASFPIAISVVLNLVYLRAGTIFLSVYKTQADVGIFGQPFKILEVLISLPAIFAGLLMPVLSKQFAEKNFSRFAVIYKKGFDVLAIAVVPLVVGVVLYAPELIHLVSGREFEASTLPLQILIFATAMIFFGNLFGNTVVAIDRQKNMVWGYAASAVVAVVANYMLVQRFSYIGAAVSTVISETMIAGIAMIVVFQATRVLPSMRIFVRSVLASAIMALVLIALPTRNIFAVGAIGSLLYVGIMYLFGGITVAMFKEIFSFSKQQQPSPVGIDFRDE